MVDGRVGLDHMVDRVAVGEGHRTLQRADDARRDGALEPERVADRDHRLADLTPSESASPNGAKRLAGSSTRSTQVGCRIRPYERRVDGLAVRSEADADGLGAVHDMEVA